MIIDGYAQMGAGCWLQADQSALLRCMQRARLDRMIVSSRLGLTSHFAEGNYKLKAVLDATPQLLGYLVVNPAYPEHSIAEMRRYLASPRFVGIEIHPDTSGQPLHSEGTREIVNAYRRYQKPLLAHVWGEASVRDLELLAKECPNVRMIAAHAGGDAWAACLALAVRQLNIYLEPCSGGAERDKIEEGVARLGAHRLLFATHFPTLNPGVALGMVADARISDHDKSLILGGNATKFFNLDRHQEPDESGGD
jgi:predicted TIM-barrel fold metal-dependent hydrolase